MHGDEPEPAGLEVDLVEDFAEHLGVEVEWTVAGEEDLVGMLEDDALDLAVGGVTEENRWVDQVGLTRPYTEVGAGGDTEKHVMMVPMGENAFQSELERWLDDHKPVHPHAERDAEADVDGNADGNVGGDAS